MANTFLEIQNAVYFNLWEQKDSTTYDLATIVKPKINTVIKNICKWNYSNIMDNNVRYTWGDMIFLRNQVVYNKKADEALVNQINVWDTIIYSYSELFNDWINNVPWALWINNQIITYTTKTLMNVTYNSGWDWIETVFTTTSDILKLNGVYVDWNLVTNYTQNWKRQIIFTVAPWNWLSVQIDYLEKIRLNLSGATTLEHKAGSFMRRLFILPTKYYKHFQMIYYYNNSNNYEIPFADFRYEKPNEYFTLIGDKTLWQFLFINSNQIWNHFFYYYEYPTDLSWDTDTTVVPDTLWFDMVAPIVAGELLWQTEEDTQAQRLLTLWYWKLIDFYKDFSEPNKNNRKTIKYKVTPFSSVIWIY